MHEKTIKQLKTLKEITPDSGFVSRTRNLFIATPAPRRVVSLFAWQYAGAFAVIIILILAIPFFFMPEPTLASLDTEVISKEIHTLPINIQLEEVKYNETVQNTITDAISEASNTETNHLNLSLLEKEKSSTTQINGNKIEKTVDDLINQAIQ